MINFVLFYLNVCYLTQVTPTAQGTPSPMSRLQSGHAQAMLQQLIIEADNNQVAFSEDCSNNEPRDRVLQGVKASTTDDVLYKKWLSK